ncbi:MAG: TlpA family protein disulfide reductase [Candidatus Rokubacteria bacterium]|nr:TlpA family protein disulfide reductase [Candidatus Rokubacteria bacterium]
MWQALQEELGAKNFQVIAVALDSGGPARTEPWIRAATPTYPCLIDEAHVVADLYGMVNVPAGVWIDETGRLVRPAETAGASDAFRHHMDRTTKQMSAEGLADRERTRHAYLDALRDWAARGASSSFALSPDEVRRRLGASSSDGHGLAAAHFRLGRYLAGRVGFEAARLYFEDARRLHPESWAYRRQAWELEAPGKAGGPEFWAAVDALGERAYYPPAVL